MISAFTPSIRPSKVQKKSFDNGKRSSLVLVDLREIRSLNLKKKKKYEDEDDEYENEWENSDEENDEVRIS